MNKTHSIVPGYERMGENHSEKEYSRILTAAVISPQFCQILLADPARALTLGFAGEPFQLNKESHNLLSGIHAKSLPEFARQLSGSLAQACATAT
jgi:hypothetical protein